MFSINSQFNKSIIKLDGQKKLLVLNTTIQLYEGYYTIIHHESKSFGTNPSKNEAFIKLIRSESFIIWYNKKIAKVLGYDHLPYSKWSYFTKNIVFQIMKNNTWVDIDENFFLLDFE